MLNVQLALFQDARKLLPWRIFSAEATVKLCDHLNSIVLTQDNVAEFMALAKQYKVERLIAMPEEQMDTLRMQPDVTIWPMKKKSSASVPIPAVVVSSFFEDLYNQTHNMNTTWLKCSFHFLRHSKVQFQNITMLQAEVSEAECQRLCA